MWSGETLSNINSYSYVEALGPVKHAYRQVSPFLSIMYQTLINHVNPTQV